jgi:hypothetical protein
MNAEELQSVIKAILDRGNPKYTTPSGAFLELLREHAKKRKIEEISESCVVYCESYPEARRFIAARIPGILVNHYFTIREDLNYEKFIQFSIKTENWADGVKETTFSPKIFLNEVESVIEKANNFEG